MKKRVMSIVLIFMIIMTSLIHYPVRCEAAITVYSQTDPRWESHQYGYGNAAGTQKATINQSGCGILSLVNAVFYMNGKFIDPIFLADYSVRNGHRINGQGTAWSLYPAFAKDYGTEYGFSYDGTCNKVSEIGDYLQSGNVAIISVVDHLMACVDYDASSKKFLILDSYKSSNRGTYSNGYRWLTASEFTGKLLVNKVIKLKNISSNPDTCSCSTSYAGKYIVSTSSQPLAMRSGHGTGYSVKTYIPKGSEVSVSKSDGTWAHVEWNGQSGFCSMQYLTKEKSSGIESYIDEVSAGMNCIKIKGWAFDRASMSRKIEVHVYVGDQVYGFTADQYYKSVDDYYGCGEYHGLFAEIPIEQAGEYNVRIFAYTPEAGQNPLLCEKTVNVTLNNDIEAYIDEVSAGVNSIKIKGWVFDRGFMSRQVEVHVYVGNQDYGTQAYGFTADQYYKSVDDRYGCGEYHGLFAEIPIEQAGEYSVRVFAITPETNINPMLCEKTVTVVSDNENPVISNITVSNVSSQGYTVNCEVTDNVRVNRVQFPTWTEYEGQDDILPEWTQSPEASGTINGNKVSFRVNTSSHNNETGTYITHIYAYDDKGNASSDSVKVVVNNSLTPIAVSHLDGHIYAVFNETYSWKEAKNLCESMGGHLATVTSKRENDFIKTLLGENYYYIGATDEQTEGQWKWVTGEKFSYTNWGKEQPDNANNNEHYLMLYSDGTWNDLTLNCSNTGFVLEIDNMELPVSTITEGGFVYEIYDVSVPWEIAEEYCEMKGGTLACITSEEEEKTVERLIERGKKQNYQLGATDKEEEGNWKWITGETISYALWMQGEPNNRSGSEASGPENYLTFSRDNGWCDMKSLPGNSGFILEKIGDASLELSVSSLTLDLAKNPKQTIKVDAVGKLPSSYTFSASKDVNSFNTQWGDWDGDSSSYLIIAKKTGEYTINFNLLDTTNGTTVIATKTIPVTVKCSHQYGTKTIDSTCTTEGYTLHTCNLCQYSYKDSYTSKKGHRYGSWENVKSATCTEEGIDRRICLDCSITETKSTAATGHHFDKWDTIKNPTCTTKGTKIRKCIQCGIQETADIEPLTHQYREEIIEPTTTTKGYTLHTCINCGDSYKDNYKDAIEPPKVAETEHRYGEWEIVKPVTCTENGMKRRICSGCGEIETCPIEAVGHHYSSWEVTKSATCTQDGIQIRTCLECGAIETKTIQATGHQYCEEIIEPTITTQGYTLHTCTICGDSYKDNYKNAIEPPKVSETEHHYGEWEIIRPATCTENGIEMRICLECEAMETKTIQATGHQYNEKVIEPTTTTQGYTLHTCTMCGYSYEDNYKEAIQPSENPLVKYGDVNGDGDVNIMDGVIIKKHLAHINVGVNNLNSDVNCDNTVNIQDAVILIKYLAKMNVVLGKKSSNFS